VTIETEKVPQNYKISFRSYRLSFFIFIFVFVLVFVNKKPVLKTLAATEGTSVDHPSTSREAIEHSDLTKTDLHSI